MLYFLLTQHFQYIYNYIYIYIYACVYVYIIYIIYICIYINIYNIYICNIYIYMCIYIYIYIYTCKIRINLLKSQDIFTYNIVIRNGKIVWMVVLIEYYWRSNLNFQRQYKQPRNASNVNHDCAENQNNRILYVINTLEH